LSVDPQDRVRAGTARDHPPSKKEGAMRVNDPAAPLHGSQRKERTTLLALVQALTRQGHSDREVLSEVLRLAGKRSLRSAK
jgi:hypothetical protein